MCLPHICVRYFLFNVLTLYLCTLFLMLCAYPVFVCIVSYVMCLPRICVHYFLCNVLTLYLCTLFLR